MTDPPPNFDWEEIERVSGCNFNAHVRDAIEANVHWYRTRNFDYTDDITPEDFAVAYKALGVLQRTEFSCSRIEPIEDELVTVLWFLEVMSQQPSARLVYAKYFFYYRIWKCMGVAGVKLTQGRGTPEIPLSHGQRVFREICRQASVEFRSDQGLAEALRRALKAVSATGAD